MKKWILWLILALCVGVNVYSALSLYKPVPIEGIVANTVIPMEACLVAESDTYLCIFPGDQRVLCKINANVKTGNEIVVEVEKIFESGYGVMPEVKFLYYNKIAKMWVVDITLSIDGKATNMVDVLKDKGLLR